MCKAKQFNNLGRHRDNRRKQPVQYRLSAAEIGFIDEFDKMNEQDRTSIN
jgi:hypothetical protein